MEDEITDISINFLPAFCVGIGIGLFWAKKKKLFKQLKLAMKDG